MYFSLKIRHLVAPIFHFPWLSKEYFPPTIPWPLKFPDFFQFSLTCRNGDISREVIVIESDWHSLSAKLSSISLRCLLLSTSFPAACTTATTSAYTVLSLHFLTKTFAQLKFSLSIQTSAKKWRDFPELFAEWKLWSKSKVSAQQKSKITLQIHT